MESQRKSGQKPREPRKIMAVNPCKYESLEAVHRNKKYWKRVFQTLDSGCQEPFKEKEITFLSETLPSDLFKKVCGILGIDKKLYSPQPSDDVKEKTHRTMIKEPLLSYRKTLVINRELDSDTDVEFHSSETELESDNIHREFLSKPEREQITWATRYLQPEREDEKSLVKKADDLTDRISQEFCEYMKQLGGDQHSQLFTPKAIKELFQIEFDTHVARSLQVVPKEMPSVEERVANVTGNEEKSHYMALEREITKDVKAERHADYVTAFDRRLPRHEQWRAPRNNTKNMWRSARHVPKDLVSLKAVWEGITNLRSVKEYCRWMIDHPEHRRAPYLSSLGMFDPAVLNARLTFETRQDDLTPPICSPQNTPVPIEQIRRRLSELADPS
ncbi:uncharacterized protein [Epargyreus clarus]|uniref:uncharacterized protein n=1 Tax=Epargyreus clarus TaxID=520877 RepID=UPI003C2CE7FA